ncbi:hypothetical protein IMF23_15255 [Chelatococcus daeguensis]|uniref:Uncharacterized protein n=2 Tax=Chelatococcus TaxID=28209 RepID=A0AAC9JP33_9HYPH|nr:MULTISPECIES: hypothetical protein [Chelatococcus]APF37019.1 hypothetical protein BOQ54_06490 [Chelatococcus daeguensis]KZE33620.1 hypothetical protein AVW15_18620 [Chelatococcus daeguensis]MBM3084799.1 hypothetical protein [Chelatococcus daeguensis]CUA88006.1 hypothetical protein Ga0061061_104146 [Chelatococcus sambhunathii]
MSDIAGHSGDNLVAFPMARRLERAPAPPEECGTVLLFTGVRYSRWGSDDADPAGRSGGGATTGRSQRAGRSLVRGS